MIPPDSPPLMRRWLFALLIGVLLAGGSARPVAAHTDFESSSPADGAVVTGPVEEISVTFTSSAAATDDGFEILDGDGSVRVPTTISIDDDRIFRLGFDPPLASGTVGVRWSVRSSDTHTIAGSFSFTIAVPTTTTPVTSAPAIAPPAVSSPTETGPTVTSPTSTRPASTSPASTVPSETELVAGATTPDAATDDALDAFLAVDDRPEGTDLARLGRLVGFTGVVLGLGVLAFAASTLVGSRGEVLATLRSIRLLGGVVAVGAIVEYVGVARLLDTGVGQAWSESGGVATGLRGVGGIALVIGTRATIVTRRRPAPLSAAAVTPMSAALATPAPAETDRFRWRPDRSSAGAAAGSVALLASFWLDGHTVTEGVRPLHALVNTVHIASASVWVGGVVALGVLAWARSRSGRPSRFGELVVRFSSVATVALLAVALAGAAMTLMIADPIDGIADSDWGQLLILKVAAVAVAAGFGSYNHFRLRPALRDAPDDVDLLVRVRNVLTAEAIVLGFVLVVTAWLVVAAPS